MSKRFKLVLFIRFLGYLIFFGGLLSIVFVFGPIFQAEAGYRWNKIFGIQKTLSNEVSPQPTGQTQNNTQPVDNNNSFANLHAAENTIIPVSTDYGIVIEKIEANAKIIPGVNPANEKDYVQALTKGVAEALGSTKPGEKGNLYLFSHSTDAPWNIIRYNAIFYLLNKLEAGDRVVIFYLGRRYDYIVFDKNIVEPSDVSYLTNRYDAPVLTLQTCDPPGTLFKRLVVRARLAGS